MATEGPSWSDPPRGIVLGASRGRVLELLRSAGRPVGTAEVAQRLGLHPNTARFHLDGLADAGLVARTFERRDVPGRPRAFYESTLDSAVPERRSYRLLAEILTSDLANRNRDSKRAATAAGEAWARSLLERDRRRRRVGDTAATRILTGVLDEVGFAPETVGPARAPQILLHHCPFREVAQEHSDVVCAIHLGLMHGVLAELGSSLDADRLEPFVEPNLCVASLSKSRQETTRSGEE